jgi:hypothetical protein
MKILLILLLVQVLTSCKTKELHLCEEYLEKINSRYEESCLCIVRASKENNIDPFEDFIKFLSNEQKVKDLSAKYIQRSFFNAKYSKKTEQYISAIQDISLCDPPYKDEPAEDYLLSSDGYFISSIGDANIVLTEVTFRKHKKLIVNNLYRETSFVKLYAFVLSKISNTNIKKLFQISNDAHNKEMLELLDKYYSTQNRKNILSFFDNNFARMTYYFKEYKYRSDQEAIDQAYTQAYLFLINLVKNINFTEPKLSEFQKRYIESNKAIYDKPQNKFIYAKEHSVSQ